MIKHILPSLPAGMSIPPLLPTPHNERSIDCGFSSIVNMVQSCFASLVNSLLVHLRSIPVPARHEQIGAKGKAASPSWSGDDDESTTEPLGVIADVVCVLLLYRRIWYEETDQRFRNGPEAELLSLKVVIVKLVKHFDRSVGSLPEKGLLQFLALFRISPQVFNCSLDELANSASEDSRDNEPSWIRALDCFTKVVVRKQILVDSSHQDSSPLLPIHGRVTKNDTDLLSSLLTRSSHLLSHDSSLFVQVASCQALEAGFDFLGVVSRLQKRDNDNNDEPNGAQTAL